MNKTRTTLALLALVLAIAWLPARAQAQQPAFSFVLSPATLSALPGTVGLTFSGTLTNPGPNTIAFSGNDSFTLSKGPAGADLSLFPISEDTFFGPNSLAAGSTVSRIFSLDIDSAAPLGTYTGNISFGYGGHIVGRTVTVNVGTPSPVPEASTLPLLTLGVGYLGYVLFIARRRRATVC